VLAALSEGDFVKGICAESSLSKLLSWFKSAQGEDRHLSLDPIGLVWELFALQVWYDVWYEGRAI